MSGHKICFCLEIRKIIFELSSITLLIWSSGTYFFIIVDMLLNLTMKQIIFPRVILIYVSYIYTSFHTLNFENMPGKYLALCYLYFLLQNAFLQTEHCLLEN